jgi:hypothetical protein
MEIKYIKRLKFLPQNIIYFGLERDELTECGWSLLMRSFMIFTVKNIFGVIKCRRKCWMKHVARNKYR